MMPVKDVRACVFLLLACVVVTQAAQISLGEKYGMLFTNSYTGYDRQRQISIPEGVEEISRSKICRRQCPPFSTLDPHKCECIPCPSMTCQFSQTLNPSTCECECPQRQACRSPQIYDDIICTCRCNNIHKCGSDQIFNLETCRCECSLTQNSCQANQYLNPIQCRCINIPPPPSPPPTSPAPVSTASPTNCPSRAEQNCNSRQIFIPSTCECMCTVSAQECNALQELNHDTCECECVEVLPAPEEVDNDDDSTSGTKSTGTGTRSGTTRGTKSSRTGTTGTKRSRGTKSSRTGTTGTKRSRGTKRRGKRRTRRRSKSGTRRTGTRRTGTKSTGTRSKSEDSETEFTFPSATRFCPAGQFLDKRTCRCHK